VAIGAELAAAWAVAAGAVANSQATRARLLKFAISSGLRLGQKYHSANKRSGSTLVVASSARDRSAAVAGRRHSPL